MSDSSNLTQSALENLVFEVLLRDPAHRDTKWLYPYANSEKRDISAIRTEIGSGGQVISLSRIVQCRTLVASEIQIDDVILAKQQVALWDPPFDLLTLVTTSSFSEEAQRWARANNAASRRPAVELVSGRDLKRLVTRSS